MKNIEKYISVLFLLISFGINAQIGVNTSSPAGILHIHTGNSLTDISNDVVVSNGGNLGIGTATPSKKLEIETSGTVTLPVPGMRLKDGYEANQKILMSDNTGNGKWSTPASASIIFGTMPTSASTFTATPFNNGYAGYTGMNITLDPGDYQIGFSVLVEAIGSIPNERLNYGFASIFLTESLSVPVTPITSYLSDIRSIIINPNANQSLSKSLFYGSGGIPVRVATRTTFYVYTFFGGVFLGTDTRLISYGESDASSQIYAIPIYVAD